MRLRCSASIHTEGTGIAYGPPMKVSRSDFVVQATIQACRGRKDHCVALEGDATVLADMRVQVTGNQTIFRVFGDFY